MTTLHSRMVHHRPSLFGAGAFVFTLGATTAVTAQPTPLEPSAPASSAAARPWSEASPGARVGEALVIHVIVALCSNEYIHCGGKDKGDPTNLDENLYWGALFGARRIFDSPNSPWTRVASTQASGSVLEHLVYKRSGGPFGDVFVSLEAWNGSNTDQAIERFWNIATGGGQVSVGGQPQAIHAVGYVGYNRLLDDVQLPGAASGQAIPSFVIARSSERTFGRKLREAGSFPLITTTGTVAPEGYTISAAARALGDNYSARAIRSRMIEEYKRYQKIPEQQAARTFAWPQR